MHKNAMCRHMSTHIDKFLCHNRYIGALSLCACSCCVLRLKDKSQKEIYFNFLEVISDNISSCESDLTRNVQATPTKRSFVFFLSLDVAVSRGLSHDYSRFREGKKATTQSISQDISRRLSVCFN
jgi:hypothetical protein